jgi:hypothetical protein
MTFSTCARHPRRQTGTEAPGQSGYTIIATMPAAMDSGTSTMVALRYN